MWKTVLRRVLIMIPEIIITAVGAFIVGKIPVVTGKKAAKAA